MRFGRFIISENLGNPNLHQIRHEGDLGGIVQAIGIFAGKLDAFGCPGSGCFIESMPWRLNLQ